MDLEGEKAGKNATRLSLDHTKRQLEEKTEALQELKKELSEVKGELAAQVVRVKTLQAELESTEDGLARQKKERKAAEEATRVLIGECSVLKSELTSAERSRDEALRVGASAQAEVTDLRRRLEAELTEKDLALENLCSTQTLLDETAELLAVAKENQVGFRV